MRLNGDECKSCLQLLEGHNHRLGTRPETEVLTLFQSNHSKGEWLNGNGGLINLQFWQSQCFKPFLGYQWSAQVSDLGACSAETE
jgi:hypothetical protein